MASVVKSEIYVRIDETIQIIIEGFLNKQQTQLLLCRLKVQHLLCDGLFNILYYY